MNLKEEKTVQVKRVDPFFYYVRRTKPYHEGRDALADFAEGHFEINHTDDPSISEIHILESKDPDKKNILTIPLEARKADKHPKKYHYIKQFVRLVSAYCIQHDLGEFPVGDIIEKIDEANEKHTDWMNKRKRTLEKNKLKKEEEAKNNDAQKNEEREKLVVIPRDETKTLDIPEKQEPKKETPKPKPKKVNPNPIAEGEHFTRQRIHYAILKGPSADKKEAAQRDGSTFLSYLKQDPKNELLHDFIESKFVIMGNSKQTKTWEVTKEPSNDEDTKGTLHLAHIFSKGNHIAITELQFVKKFTEKYEDQIETFKIKAQKAADAGRRPRPYT